MSTSLAAFLPKMEKSTGLSNAALYERQRALVRLGILQQPQGRGRGAQGAVASPGTVAHLLIAVLWTDSLAAVNRQVVQLASAKPKRFSGSSQQRCMLTNKTNFADAVAAVLAGEVDEKASDVEVEVARAKQMGCIHYKHGGKIAKSEFVFKTSSKLIVPISVNARVTAKALEDLIKELAVATAESSE